MLVPALLGNHDRSTDQPTNRPTDATDEHEGSYGISYSSNNGVICGQELQEERGRGGQVEWGL